MEISQQETVALAKAVEKIGGYAQTARKLGLKTAWAVQKWQRCPPHHVLALEAATEGAVTRYELRPALYPREEAA